MLFQIIQDICRGMAYLASTPIKSHGRLKSSNCVIDNRWTLKITGMILVSCIYSVYALTLKSSSIIPHTGESNDPAMVLTISRSLLLYGVVSMCTATLE